MLKNFYNKIKIIIKSTSILEILLWLAVVISIMVKLFYFQFTTKINHRPIINEENIYMLLSSFGVILIIMSIFIIAFNKKRLAMLIILDFVLSLLIFSDTIYYRYYYSTLTVAVLYQLRLVGSVGDSILSLLKIKDIVYFIDFPFFIAFIYLIKRFNENKIRPFKFRYRASIAVIICVLGYATFSFSYKNADKDSFPYDNNYIIRKIGINYFHYYDIKRFVKDNLLTDRTLSAEEKTKVETYYDKKPKTSDDFKGIAEGKNLIIVQVEALQGFVINKKTLAGVEITPNLNKLIKESAYFDNMYFQIGGGNTSDAEFLVNTSLYPVKEGSVYFRFPTNKYHSLGNILKEKDYGTYVFHANNPTFWNRNIAYESLGFDSFMSNKAYTLNEYIGWGLGDASFFKQSLDSIDIEKPFYSFMLTLSSHFPFNFVQFEDYDLDVGKYEGHFLGDYIKAINYTDYAIGCLIEDLKEKNLYDNSLLIIYGDHMAVPKDHSEELLEFLNIEYSDFNWAKLQTIPFIVHYPGLENGTVINTTAGQIDVLPTIANLMNFEVPYAMGKDLFNTKNGYAVLRNNSVITDNYYYLSNLGKAFDINTGTPLDPAAYEKELKSLQNELVISEIIIQKDALK